MNNITCVMGCTAKISFTANIRGSVRSTQSEWQLSPASFIKHTKTRHTSGSSEPNTIGVRKLHIITIAGVLYLYQRTRPRTHKRIHINPQNTHTLLVRVRKLVKLAEPFSKLPSYYNLLTQSVCSCVYMSFDWHNIRVPIPISRTPDVTLLDFYWVAVS